ncbi:3372_t:CDS:2 [Scutellospora calospora]|uniref:3372_t:CDS:1 n=1 Tax=Scutellospora calospora TaxID=85575 RepID=A0ACA9K5H2_9GLOM|nr:3372_t:CDS:2 [Scutellospora calospora]
MALCLLTNIKTNFAQIKYCHQERNQLNICHQERNQLNIRHQERNQLNICHQEHTLIYIDYGLRANLKFNQKSNGLWLLKNS